MRLKNIFDNSQNNSYPIYYYQRGDEDCDVLEYIKRINDKNRRQELVEYLKLLTQKGKDECFPPSFDEAGEIFETWILYRIRKGQDRIYLGFDVCKKRFLLIEGCKKKTQKTKENIKRKFVNLVKKIEREKL